MAEQTIEPVQLPQRQELPDINLQAELVAVNVTLDNAVDQIKGRFNVLLGIIRLQQQELAQLRKEKAAREVKDADAKAAGNGKARPSPMVPERKPRAKRG